LFGENATQWEKVSGTTPFILSQFKDTWMAK